MPGQSKMSSASAAPTTLVAAAEAVPKPKARRLVRNDTNKQVQKKIYDHFRDFSDTQKYVLTVNGLTLQETLQQDTRSNRLGNGPAMGSAYYVQKRKDFALTNSPSLQLVAANPSEEIRASLREAMKALKSKPVQRVPMLLWLKGSDYQTNRETVGISRVLLEQVVTKSAEQRDLVLQGMLWFKTNGVNDKE
jgi:hypothetical protein